MAKRKAEKPLVTDHSKPPHEIYSLKIEYIDFIEECGEGPGELIRKPGGERFVMSGYHNQDSIFDFWLHFKTNYEGCTVKSFSLVKVIFTDDIHHGPEIVVGQINFPVGFDWIKPETWPKVEVPRSHLSPKKRRG